MQRYCILKVLFCIQKQIIISIYNIMATKKKDLHRKEVLARKRAIQSLEFLTSFGLKRIDAEHTFHKYADAELKEIIELDLCKDLLEIKKLVDGIKQHFDMNITENRGDLCNSPVCIALGISRVEDIHNVNIHQNMWRDLLNKKIISIYYQDEIRNKAVGWARENGYITSTHLGQPIIKLSRLFLSIKRSFPGDV